MSQRQVFLSYAKEDASTAKMLSEALQHAGLSVWWDRHIPPGRTWDEVIGRALDSAACVVVLWSKVSVESRWVREEADRAARRGCLIPAMIEKVDPPFGFGRLEAADLTEWRGDEAHPGFLDLRAAVSDLVKSGDLREQSAAVEEPPKPVPLPPKAPSRLPWIAAGAALVLVVGIVISQYVPFNPPGVEKEEPHAIPVEAPRPPATDPDVRIPGKPRPTEEPLRVIVRPEPPSVSTAERTTIVVRVVDAAGAPVQGAEVTVSAGGGKFLRPDEPFDPRSTLQSPYRATGFTDQDGAYATGWVCNPCAGGYGMSVEATKPGFLGTKADFDVRILTEPLPRDPGIPIEAARPLKPDLKVRIPGQPRPREESLRLTVTPEPPSVSAGERTTIVVRVLDAAGAPVPGAAVTVAAGGGKFLRLDEPFDPGSTLQSPYSATGVTDHDGRYATAWVCNPCAGGYGMSVEATKPGFLGAKADFDVRIRR